jgi:uncharacterized membrane protein YebE (DUF533 family)
MSDDHQPRRGLHAVIIALGIVAAIGATAGTLYTDWKEAQPKPIDRTATRWANSIAEQDAESRQNNDPAYRAPTFPDNEKTRKPMKLPPTEQRP